MHCGIQAVFQKAISQAIGSEVVYCGAVKKPQLITSATDGNIETSLSISIADHFGTVVHPEERHQAQKYHIALVALKIVRSSAHQTAFFHLFGPNFFQQQTVDQLCLPTSHQTNDTKHLVFVCRVFATLGDLSHNGFCFWRIFNIIGCAFPITIFYKKGSNRLKRSAPYCLKGINGSVV